MQRPLGLLKGGRWRHQAHGWSYTPVASPGDDKGAPYPNRVEYRLTLAPPMMVSDAPFCSVTDTSLL